MRKFLLLSMGFVACAWFSSCSNDIEEAVLDNSIEMSDSHFVSVEQAKKNADTFMNKFRGIESRNAGKSYEVEDVVTCRTSDFGDIESRGSSTQPIFYAINFKNDEGFVLASTDDRYVPVYAYVEKGKFTGTQTENEEFNLFLYNIAMKFTDKKDSTLLAENAIMSPTVSQVNPLISVEWGNGFPYNTYSFFSNCPPMSAALTQICSYYQQPTSASYTDFGVTTSFTMNWTSILAESGSNGGQLVSNTTNANAVAHLMHYFENPTYTIETMFNSEKCIGYARDLGYKTSVMYSLDDDSDVTAIQNALNLSRLIYARGYATNNSGILGNGHAWVIDGYVLNLLHCNWGWDGLYNGYFTLNGFQPYSSVDYQYQTAYSIIYHL